MRLVAGFACVVALAGPALADGNEPESPDAVAATEAPPRYYIAGGASGIFVDTATMVGSYRLDAGRRVVGPLWVDAHLARSAVIVDDQDMMETDIHATELGAGVELRRCNFPWLVCGAVGVTATSVIDDSGAVSGALLPHVDGEIGLGNLALRLGLEGRFGRETGVGASTALVMRF